MSDSNSSNFSFLTAVLLSLFYVLNLYFSSSNLVVVSYLILIAASFVFYFLKVVKNSNLSLVVLLLFTLLSFPEFSPDPYSEDFVSPFFLAKYVAFLTILLFSTTRVNSLILMILLMCLVISFFIPFFYGRTGNIKSELLYVVLLVMFLTLNLSKLTKYGDYVQKVLQYYFFLLIPISLIVEILGLSDVREGATINFFGHWLGILTSFVLYKLFAGADGFGLKFLLKILYTFFIINHCIYSYQSIHFLMMFFSVVFAFLTPSDKTFHKNFFAIAFLIFFPIVLMIIVNSLAQNDWLYLKLTQVFTLFTGGFVGVSDSVTIRFAQAQSLYLQSDLINLIFGNGISATYQAQGELWQYVTLHDATYPSEQLSTGNYQYIHESLVMIYKWGGFLLLLLILILSLLKNKKYGYFSLPTLMFVFFIILFTSSIHTCLLLMFMYCSVAHVNLKK